MVPESHCRPQLPEHPVGRNDELLPSTSARTALSNERCRELTGPEGWRRPPERSRWRRVALLDASKWQRALVRIGQKGSKLFGCLLGRDLAACLRFGDGLREIAAPASEQGEQAASSGLELDGRDAGGTGEVHLDGDHAG